MSEIHDQVQQYYGVELQESSDLKTDACCTIAEPESHIKEALALIHDEVMAKYYGCGLVVPDQMEGMKVLDLGCGSGRDVYVMSQLVGEHGQVVGLDMTQEQLDVAQRHIDYHADRFGYATSNVRFIKGNIDALEETDLEPGSFDVIISNCVINLVENKSKVLRDIFKLLKPGGEFYFSDVYADRRMPEHLKKDPVLWGECLSGALYWNDFLRVAKDAGFTDPRVIESHTIGVQNETLKKKLGNITFHSVTYRLFNIQGLESDCEDYGQAVAYKGTVEHRPHALHLDDHHEFPAGKIMPVCGNSYKMLYDTRFKDHFDFYGTWDTHYGIFEGCGGSAPFNISDATGEEAPCC